MRITDTEMTSDETVHRAELTSSGKWAVSWLPGRLVDRSQATTAMVIAETVAVMVEENADCTHRKWWHLDDWAAELGLTGPEAMARVTEPEVVQDAPDPGPVPPVVEPESDSRRVTTIAVAPQVQVVVTAGHAGTDMVGLTLRGPHTSITTALSTPMADALGEALAAAVPVPYELEPRSAGQVWDDAVAPGGWVCAVCGVPVESEPCAVHDYAAWVDCQAGGGR